MTNARKGGDDTAVPGTRQRVAYLFGLGYLPSTSDHHLSSKIREPLGKFEVVFASVVDVNRITLQTQRSHGTEDVSV